MSHKVRQGLRTSHKVRQGVRTEEVTSGSDND